MISVNRIRDNVTPEHPLFEDDQGLGPFLPSLFQQIVNNGIRLVLTDHAGQPFNLVTQGDWNELLARYLTSSQAPTTDRVVAESLESSLGISFTNFVRMMDDIANAPERNVTVNLTRESAGARLLQLYDPGDSYLWNALEGADAPIASGASTRFRATAGRQISRQILAAPSDIRGRNRLEVEAHANFQYTVAAEDLFGSLSGNVLWQGLDLRDLNGNFWDDAQRMQLVLQFRMPVHLETRPGGGYQDATSPFLDAYLDTEEALLANHSLSLRARKRPDQNERGLIQMKQEYPRQDGRPVREKWERRYTINAPEMNTLVEQAATGLDSNGSDMPELRKLYEKLSNGGGLSPDGLLRLRPEHFIVQRRRRTHLRLDDLDTVGDRVEFLRQVASSQNPPAAALIDFLRHVEKQWLLMQDADRIFAARGMDMPFGEAVIVSHDRWSVFEPGAYATNDWPTRLNGPGLRGKGLRVEAELDAWTSEPISDALALIDEALALDPTNSDLQRDRQVMLEFQTSLFDDVSRTVDMKRQIMLDAGLVLLTAVPVDKSDAAREMIRMGQEGFRQGHRFWV